MGKILVVVNLIFSLVTGALLIVVFATRTNWKAENVRLASEIKNYAAARQDAVNERDAALKDSEDKRRTLLANLSRELNVQVDQQKPLDQVYTDLTAGIKTLQKQQAEAVANERAKTAKADLDAKLAQTNLENITAVNHRLHDEITGLQADVEKRNQKITTLLDESKGWHDRFVDADLRAKSALDRNSNLLQQLEVSSKEIERLKVAGGGAGPRNGVAASNPPPEDVHGRVKSTDAQSGYVTIDIGSDAGINRDNTLEVYRLQPEPRYLGTIRIVAVNAHEAVGRPVTTQRKGLIQVGDEVAANIGGKR
jgi:hypothetical protein